MTALVQATAAARLIGCSVPTVRNLAERGELPVADRTPRGQRLYDPDVCRRVGVAWRARWSPEGARS